MAAKSVLLKLSPEVHAQVLAASSRHQRSMQKLLVALIESWLAQGAQDPVDFAAGASKQAQESDNVDFVDTVDQQARQVVDLLSQRIMTMQDELQELQSWRETVDRGIGTGGFSSVGKRSSGTWDALVREAADTPVASRQALASQRSKDGNSPRPHPLNQEQLSQLQNARPGLINTLRP